MLNPEQVRSRAAELGVPQLQIERDHVVSHLLNALEHESGVVFFGGTALNRTFLPGRRISEDIDLYLIDEDGVQDDIVQRLLAATSREYPDLTARRSQQDDVATYILTGDSLAVKLQIVGRRYENTMLPASTRPVDLFYDDLPKDVQLRVPTRSTFTAMKLVAFADRRVPRDLFDLHGLAEIGAVNEEAIELCIRLRSAGPKQHEYENAPPEAEWHAELGHQVRVAGDPEVSLAVVRNALGRLLGWG